MFPLLVIALLGHTSAFPTMDACESLLEPPQLQFDQELANVTAAAGAAVTLSCSVYSAPQATIYWFFRGRQVESHPGAVIENVLPRRMIGSGLVESRLHIPCLDAATAGEYHCEARTICGSGITSHAKVQVSHASKAKCNSSIAEPAWISLFTVSRLELSGNPVQLMCRAKGNPVPLVKWQRVLDDESLEDLDNYTEFMPLSNGDLLVIADDDMVTSSFRCTARNMFGSDSIESTVLLTEDAKK